MDQNKIATRENEIPNKVSAANFQTKSHFANAFSFLNFNGSDKKKTGKKTDDNELFRILIEEMTEGAVTFTLEGRILYCNKSFANLVKKKKEDILSTLITDYVHPSCTERLKEIHDPKHQTPIRKSMKLMDSVKEVIPSRISLHKIHVEKHEIFLMTVIDEREKLHIKDLNHKHVALQNLTAKLRSAREDAENAVRLVKEKNIDIAKLNQEYVAINNALEKANKELMEAKQKAEKSDRLKSAFIANMSHEIRTPLNSILGYTKMLLEHCPDDEQKENINVIIRSSGHLLNLINDIVDISRLEADELSVLETNVYLDEMMQEMEKQFIAYALNNNKQNIEFRLQLPKGNRKNLRVKTDESRVKQVLSNLLSNAFKYTMEGCIEFGYDILNSEELVFYIRDTGLGISAEDQEVIFNRFQQGSNPAKKVVSGTGLGLAISKGIAALLGGSIGVESKEGYGSTFYFTIPFKEVKEKIVREPLIKHAELIGIPQLHGKSIMVSEDDFYSREMMIHLLKKTGVTLTVAKDGQETMHKFKKGKFDLLLLDIRLPEIDGYQVLKHIRKQNADVIVIAQTAYAMLEDIRRLKEAGFNDYLSKPINDDLLYAMLHKYLS